MKQRGFAKSWQIAPCEHRAAAGFEAHPAQFSIARAAGSALPRVGSHESLLFAAMTNGLRPPPEIIGYRRSTAIPGLEVLDANDSPREWRAVGPAFAVTVLRTWRGDVLYHGRTHAVEPGIAFCNHPDEALVARPAGGQPGSFNVLVMDPDLFREWVTETQVVGARAQWAAVTKPISAQLRGRFARFLGVLSPMTPPLELQTEATELSESLVRELAAGATDATLGGGPPIRGTARMRECLNETGFDVDLASLAKHAGLSRFQALRAFKRRYGLPPHAYQLCVRVTLARKLLLEGAPPADVAVQCGFVDQSHLIRHFKRVVGVTPMQYAPSHAASKSKSGTHRVAPPLASEGVTARSERRRG
jgi:AraC-like DNA-binding protein